MGASAEIQVLGAIAYGEWKAYEKATNRAEAADDEAERRAMKKVAAEELRHHKGFVRRLEAIGADPERAMSPYRDALDSYHGARHDDPVAEAMWGYLGEGVADDLLSWLRSVVDDETAAFVDSVIADEEEHEELATERLRILIDATPDGPARARRAARQMLLHMLGSSRGGSTNPLRFLVFLRLGRPHALLAALVTGWTRRLRAVGVDPIPLPGLRTPR